MPTVLRISGFRFFFYSMEESEPPHIYVEHGDNVAKFGCNQSVLRNLPQVGFTRLAHI
jgi:Domain of unknown function (DUF4160)